MQTIIDVAACQKQCKSAAAAAALELENTQPTLLIFQQQKITIVP